MQAELEALEKGLGNPKRPVVAIVGGAKVSTKIDLLMNLVKKVDALVIGGGMANTFLAARGDQCRQVAVRARSRRRPPADHDLEKAKAAAAIVLPVDGVVAREFKADAASDVVVIAVPADAMILDVGPKSIEAVNRLDRPRADAGLERPARRLRDRALRHGDRRAAKHAAGRPRHGQARLGGRRRRHGGGAQPCRRGRRLHLCLDRGRRLPRMDGRQDPARRGETTEQAARREALEEACATIEIDRLLAMYSVARIGQVQIMYRAKLVTADIACGVESEEVALVDWADIPWEQLAFPTVVWALAHFHESRDKVDFSTYSNPTGDLARMWPPRKPAGV
jgi:hypothetical protein